MWAARKPTVVRRLNEGIGSTVDGDLSGEVAMDDDFGGKGMKWMAKRSGLAKGRHWPTGNGWWRQSSDGDVAF